MSATAQSERQITVTENIAYRTDVGPSTVLDLAQPLFGPQQDRPAILIIHGGGWSAGSKNDLVYRADGTYEQPGGGANARMVRAWLDWQLKDKEENAHLFLDGDLTDYDGFTIQHKNFE